MIRRRAIARFAPLGVDDSAGTYGRHTILRGSGSPRSRGLDGSAQGMVDGRDRDPPQQLANRHELKAAGPERARPTSGQHLHRRRAVRCGGGRCPARSRGGRGGRRWRPARPSANRLDRRSTGSRRSRPLRNPQRLLGKAAVRRAHQRRDRGVARRVLERGPARRPVRPARRRHRAGRGWDA